jgi:hypothetical protein
LQEALIPDVKSSFPRRFNCSKSNFDAVCRKTERKSNSRPRLEGSVRKPLRTSEECYVLPLSCSKASDAFRGLAMSASGQTEKHSARADVFRSYPNN